MNRTRFASALAMAALAMILLPSFLQAQITFVRTYGGHGTDIGTSVQQTTDRGYIVSGATTSFGAGYFDVYLVKTDSSGDTVWTRSYGGTDFDQANSVQQTADNGYIVTGYTWCFGAGKCDVYMLKIDPNGDTAWTRTFGGTNEDYGYGGFGVQQTTDSGYVIVGTTNSYGAGMYDVYLIKTDENGDTLWTKVLGGSDYDEGVSVQQTSDGGYIVTGFTRSFGGGNRDVYLIKTDAMGDTVWTRCYGGANDDVGNSVRQTSDDGYIIAGYTSSFGSGRTDVWLIKTDSSGDTMWTRCYGGGNEDEGYSVRQTTDGGYVATGCTNAFGSVMSDVWLIKTDSRGDTLWTQTFRGAGLDWGETVQQTTDSGYIIAGISNENVYLIKTDALGQVAVAEPKANPTRARGLTLTCEPSPSSGTTRISLTPRPSNSEPVTLCVYDSQGCLVHSVAGIRTSSFSLDLRTLPSGAYFIRCDVADQHAATHVVLQR
jgi:hypothetical protein